MADQSSFIPPSSRIPHPSEALIPQNPLTLVSDPDAVLADMDILATLSERGFRLINEYDPVALRYAVCQALPLTPEAPVIIITTEPLETLPYDLWQQGYHIVLALHQFFPNLDYLALRELSPGQRRRLRVAQEHHGVPPAALAYRDSLDYLLQMVFDLEPERISTSTAWLTWLDAYHAQNDPMSRVLVQHLLERLSGALASLPLREMLTDVQAYQNFVQTEWASYVQKQTREHTDVTYTRTPMLSFETDQALQDLVSRLVRTGTLTPIAITPTATMPAWTAPAVVRSPHDLRHQHGTEDLAWIDQQLHTPECSWEQWQMIARRWASLTIWRAAADHGLEYDAINRFGILQADLDRQFARWLTAHYTRLATRSLPVPHHLHHVPGWLAYQYQQQPDQRLALLIIDGMALADWMQIRQVWQERHPDWCLHEHLVLAQIPSLTAISRQALISGRRPAQFSDTLLHNRHEAAHWSAFWQAQGLPTDASAYAHLSTQWAAAYPDAIDSRRIQALCLVSSVLDTKVHKESQGMAGWLATLGVWLHSDTGPHQPAVWLEGLIQQLFNLRYTVVVTSDHGHVEATGMGIPQEGVLVETRSKRARLYTNPDIVRIVQTQFADTICWVHDGLLPEHTQVLMPQGRRAFAAAGEVVVSHGGITLEELVVPLVTMTPG